GGLFPANAAHFDRLVEDAGRARGRIDTVVRGAGDAAQALLADWAAQLPPFLARRRPYLIYPE
ncbi:MAG TPA: hypothetical protein PKA50_09685, partial [Gemmatimonadales bacterium]|nr:hypothetical protein [Gemmatimonadales bacterium]